MYFAIYFLCGLLFQVHGDELVFPSDFKFGVATASFQIEGGWNASGKGENIWDRLTHEHPNWVDDYSNGDIACDSYNLWQTDVQLLRDLGVNFYRFSLSWSRLLPSGYPNYINPDGVRYYNNLIDELLKYNIEPMVTIYHWDLPQHFQDIGGWPNPLLSTYFEDYARVVFQLFGDRVKSWITFNEPYQVCESAYGEGKDAPAIKGSGIVDYLCGKTLLLSHAKAYHLYNNVFRPTQKGSIGLTANTVWSEPKTNDSKDIEAAERVLHMNYGWWLHPLVSELGDYPPIMKDRIAKISKMENFTQSRLPEFTKEEVAFLKGTYDFIGLNHYSTYLAEGVPISPSAPVSHEKDLGAYQIQDPSWKPSAAGWLKDVPWGFRKLLNWVKKEFNNPLLYITENGFADLGELDDKGRIHYYKGYLNALLEAINIDGCNVKAYTAWSLMDNMEWRQGYTLKFGLYHVDFNDPKRTRTPKASAEFYKNVIKTRRIIDDIPEVLSFK